MDIYILDLNNFDLSLLTPDLAVKTYKLRLKEKQHLAGRYILKKFAQEHNVLNSEIVYKNEKPYYASEEYYFSISHSQNMVIVGFSEFEIGLDVEDNTRKRNYVNIIKRIDSELALDITDKNAEMQRRIFYEFWTKYEAKIKLNSTANEILYWTQDMENGFTLSIASEKEIQYINIINM